MKSYSWEFDVFTDVTEDVVINIYRQATEEERQEARDQELGWVPKQIKIGEDIKTEFLRKDITLKRRVPDVRGLIIHQHFNEKGNLFRKRFIVEEHPGMKYIVKGNYKEFKEILDNIDKNDTIGY